MPKSSKRSVLAADRADVGEMILGAGASTRMGVPKQLLQFGGEPMLRRAARVALKADCRPVVVVTGANAVASKQALRGLDVREVENEQWKSGMSSSVRVGVELSVAAGASQFFQKPEFIFRGRDEERIIFLLSQPCAASEHRVDILDRTHRRNARRL